eukprot:gene23634-biopygen8751
MIPSPTMCFDSNHGHTILLGRQQGGSSVCGPGGHQVGFPGQIPKGMNAHATYSLRGSFTSLEVPVSLSITYFSQTGGKTGKNYRRIELIDIQKQLQKYTQRNHILSCYVTLQDFLASSIRGNTSELIVVQMQLQKYTQRNHILSSYVILQIFRKLPPPQE